MEARFIREGYVLGFESCAGLTDCVTDGTVGR